MSEYTVIPLSEVRPGDIAVCNGREFPVEFRGGQNQIRLGEWYVSATFASDTLGFEFRRPIPREPRTFRRCVVLNRDGNYNTSYSIENEVPAGHYAKNIGGTYFLADITEVMP